MVFKNRAFGTVFGPKRDEVAENGENYTLRSLMVCTPH